MTNFIAEAKKISNDLHFDELYNEDVKSGYGYLNEMKYAYIIAHGTPIYSQDEIFSLSYPKKIALYVHVPFCFNKCSYCPFYFLTQQSRNIVKEYLGAVKLELEILLKKTQLKNSIVNYMAFGGGTPTYLTAEELQDLISYLKNRLNLETNLTFTVEATPESIVGSNGKKKLEILRKNDVNRLSIGVQDFNNDVLKEIGRAHDEKTAILGINTARKMGFDDIGIDLILGLPGQTLEKWETTLNKTGQLLPETVDVHQLYFGSWKIYKKYLVEPEKFPNEKEICLMKIMTFEKLTELGYHFIPRGVGIFHLNNNFYPEKIVGVGPSAETHLDDGSYHNYSDLKKYIYLIKKDKLPISSGVKFTKRHFIEKEFRKIEIDNLNEKEFKAKFGLGIDEAFGNIIVDLEKLGLLVKNKDSINLTYQGKIFYVYILRKILDRTLQEKFLCKIEENKIFKIFYLLGKYNFK